MGSVWVYNKNMKILLQKYKLFVILFIIVFIIVSFLTIRENNTKNNLLLPSATPVPLNEYPRPSIYSVNTSPQSTTFTINFVPLKQQESLVTYRAVSRDALEVGTKIMSHFTTSAELSVIDEINYWKYKNLQVTSQNVPPGISFSNKDLVSNQPILESSAIQLAKDFLLKNEIVPSNTNLSQNSLYKYNTTEIHPDPSSKKIPNAVRVGFDITMDGYRIIDSTGGSLHSSVSVGGGDVIIEAFSSIVPTISINKSITPISPERAILALTNNKGVLTSADNNVYSVGASLTKPEIKTATITSMGLVYFWDKASGLIYPMYRFEGFSKSQDTSMKTVLTYVVSATP